MFARVFALLPLALLVSASHLEARDQCTNGAINCCNSVHTYSDSTDILSKLNVIVGNVGANTPLGFGCSPIGVVSASGNSCTQQTVCCTGNNFNGLVTVGCTPINANS